MFKQVKRLCFSPRQLFMCVFYIYIYVCVCVCVWLLPASCRLDERDLGAVTVATLDGGYTLPPSPPAR